MEGHISHQLTIETGQIGEIPVLVCIPQSQPPCPLVFYIPGYTSTRRSGLSLAYRLAQRQIACVSIDPLLHGERYDERVLEAAKPAYGGIYPPDSGLDVFVQFMHVIEQSALDIQTLLAVFENDPRIDVHRAGVTGHSMGACASFLALATTPLLKAAVPMMGIPTFARRWLDLLDECAWSNPDWEKALAKVEGPTQVHTEYIKRIDPHRRLFDAAPHPLLMMNGDFDTDMMKTFTLTWYREAKAAWSEQPENLQWNVYPVGHTVTPQMEADTVNWFVKHL